jgi:2,4-dienoyl-CoA reductase-like NADH-dependent reductase (Old Yellow Enzyme family)
MALGSLLVRRFSRQSSPLFSQVQLGPLTLPNRFMRSATCEGLADAAGFPKPELHSLIVSLANGDVGLIVPGFVSSSKSGIAVPGQAGFFSDNLAEPWRQTVAQVHKTQSKIVFQVCHAGSKVPAQYRGDAPALSPSGVLPNTREMTQADINDVCQDFVLCAKRLNSIGADGIQFHAAHGFLISEFLSPALNRRTDKYGRDRARILVEMAAEIRRVVGKGFAISAKINGEDYIEGGVTARVCGEYVKQSAGLVDFFEISCNASSKPFALRAQIDPEVIRAAAKSRVEEEPLIRKAQKTFEGVPYLEGYNVPAAKVVREIAPSARLAVVGGLRKFSFMEKLVKDGIVDVVSLSRPFMRQPNLVKTLKTEGKEVECSSCGLCMLGLGPLGCYYPKKKLGRK